MESPSAATSAVAEYETIEAGLFNSPNAPFIVRQCAEFSAAAVEAAIQAKCAEGSVVYGYHVHDAACSKAIEGLELKQLWASYGNGTLDFKILESPMQLVDPPGSMRALSVHQEMKQSLVLSPVGTTALHIDPPDYGGGFMYLCQGDKEWTFMDPFHTIPRVYDAANKRFYDQPQEPCNVHMRSGDFIYFPPGELHRVVTTKPSFGVGGYLMLGACARRQESVLKLLEGYDITGIYS